MAKSISTSETLQSLGNSFTSKNIKTTNPLPGLDCYTNKGLHESSGGAYNGLAIWDNRGPSEISNWYGIAAGRVTASGSDYYYTDIIINGGVGGRFARNGTLLLRNNDSHESTWKQVATIDQLATATSQPAGQVSYFAMTTPPDGWLKANGAAISRTTYAALFAAIGTTFGEGDGSTTFNLPDLRGEFFRAWDDGRGIDAEREFGSYQGDAIRNITGSMAGGLEWQPSGTGALRNIGYGYNSHTGAYNEGSAFDFDASRVVPTADENRPRNIVLLACIKY